MQLLMKILSTLSTATLLLILGSAVTIGQTLPPVQPGPGKIEPSLVQLMQSKITRGSAQEQVRVAVAIQGSLSAARRQALRRAGAEVKLEAPWGVEALVPFQKLEDVARLDFVRLIYLPFKPHKLGSAFDPSSVTWLGRWPLGGKGAKVAILDNFEVDANAPKVPGCGSNLTYRAFAPAAERTRDKHGDAIAEIICSMAPKAKIFLLDINTAVQFWNAVRYAVEDANVDVISNSNTFPSCFDFFDGSSRASTSLSEEVRDRALFVQAAGNEAMRNWYGTFSAKTTMELYRFEGTRVRNGLGLHPEGDFTVWLTWNDRNQSLSLLIGTERGDGTIDWRLPTAQSDSHVPGCEVMEEKANGPLLLGIRNSSSQVKSVTFDLDVADGVLSTERWVANRSLGGWPTAVQDVLVVGAAGTDGNLKPYSSRGPTGDGRRKPDLVSYTPVYLDPYGGSEEGTSFSTPQVAAAAALLRAQAPTMSLAELKRHLMNAVIRIDHDPNGYGAGILFPLRLR